MINISRLLYAITLFTFLHVTEGTAQAEKPLRLAVAGTSHGHSGWILGRKAWNDFELVGIFESDKTLSEKQQKQFGLAASLFYDNLQSMLDAVKPEAVVAFGSIYDHLAIVEACAVRKIHVMVEKPLAVSLAHAKQMEALAKQHDILLLTNYETSWYPSTEKSYQLITNNNFAGRLRKAVFHHGHEGPKEIGVSKEFFNWLTDPVQNGGGALIDFGCYGANIITYLLRGERPVSVTALTNQFKPHIYPKVDDEATIVVEYSNAQCIIQASWNWPYSRKDMELYGESGYIIAPDRYHIRYKNKKDKEEHAEKLDQKESGVYDDPFAYFSDAIRKRIPVPDYSLYSLSNNMLVMEILEAARESARTGKKIVLK
jgi:predicted dehydrogenase